MRAWALLVIAMMLPACAAPIHRDPPVAVAPTSTLTGSSAPTGPGPCPASRTWVAFSSARPPLTFNAPVFTQDDRTLQLTDHRGEEEGGGLYYAGGGGCKLGPG